MINSILSNVLSYNSPYVFLDIDYWLDGGTLLGACRDGKMIDIDDDIDLAIPYDSYIKLKEIIKTLKYDTFKKMYISKKYDIGFTIISRSKNSIIDDDLYKFHIKTHLLNNVELFCDLILYTKIGDNYVINNKIWKHLNLAHHSHIKEISNSGINDRNKYNYFLLS